eukprot:Gb_37638 [translate_table: standard]
MALAPVRPLWPTGLLDSLQSARSHTHGFALPTSLNGGLHSRRCRVTKFQCFSSHGTINVENSEYPPSGDSEKKKQGRYIDKTQERWSVRPSVKRKKYPWEEEPSPSSTGLQPESSVKDFPSEDLPRSEKNVSLYPPSGRHMFPKGPSLPTAPWMQAWNKPLKKGIEKAVQPAIDYAEGQTSSESEADESPDVKIDNAFETRYFDGTREKSAMQQIVEKLRKFGYVDENREKETKPEPGSVEDIFSAEPGTLPNTRGGYALDESWSAPYRVSEPNRLDKDARFPWERRKETGEEENTDKERRRRTPTLAELTIPEPDLNRLRSLGVRLKERTKVGNAGVTQAIVASIHEKWKKSEIVKIKCEGPSVANMRRMHEILERKTGGLVIWRSGGSIVLYRGMTYEYPSVKAAKHEHENNKVPALQFGGGMQSTAERDCKPVNGVYESNSIDTSDRDKLADMVDVETVSDSHLGTDDFDGTESVRPPVEADYESEINKILDGLGPRFTDWSGRDPLPVDADLLPGVVPGYKEPFRLLPYGMRPKLSNREMTNLRRLARTIPPHFALGRNRHHEGLATAMVKLWERSAIAKIALKRGVQNTNNERMAEELKRLTGGTLLSRNKEFIVFYRGKDFLSPAVTAALVEREAMTKALQDEEERARLKASEAILAGEEGAEVGPTIAGTLTESLEAKARWAKHMDSEEEKKMRIAAAKARHADVTRRLERKLALAQAKVTKAEKALAKVEAFLMPAEPPSDQETITDEERFMFRKLGLRMKAFLLLGRRGIFDGTVENMHLHWKHRELVKIISKEKSFAEVKYTALMLESESGGILVSVDKVSKGYAIIVYRGKNYHRPSTIKPKNLLTKRRALKRSIELQRRESLSQHILQLERNVIQLKYDLTRMEDVDGDENTAALNAELDSAYPSEDVESGDEEAYLEPHDSYSENEDISSELQSERGETENIEMEEENSAHSRIFGMNFEDYSAGSREVKEDDPDQFVHPLMDIQDNSTEISELEDKDVLYAQSRTAVEGHDTSNSTEAIVDKETVP